MISKGHDIKPPLYGLALAGGKSVRMGYDKGAIHWHGKEQRYFAADLLSGVCADAFISCKAEQRGEISGGYKTIVDTVEGAGPLIAILTAFKEMPDVAWLVIACDLPLMDAATLQFLVDNRDAAMMATTFKSPHDGLPEPLATIWEPASYEYLLAHQNDGYTCPRKALIRNEGHVKVLIPPNPEALMNANTPEDAEKVREIILRRV